MCMVYDPSLPGTESQGYKLKSKIRVRVRVELTDGHNITLLLLRHQLHASAARHAVLAESSACCRGNTVGLTSIFGREVFLSLKANISF